MIRARSNNMLYNKKTIIKGFLLGYSLIGLPISVEAGQLRTITGERVTSRDIQETLGTDTSLDFLKAKIKQSDLHDKIGFVLVRQPWMRMYPQNTGLFDVTIKATKHSDGINVHSLNIGINPQKCASLRSLKALGLHERHHLQELHGFRNRYYDEHNTSLQTSTAIGTAAGMLPIIRALRRTSSTHLPIKAAIALGATSGLIAYKAFEHRKIAERRGQEKDADSYMLKNGTPETIKGALEQFVCESACEALVIASKERELRTKYSYAPSQLINTYIVGRSSWYRTSEPSRDRLKKVVQFMGSDVSLESKKELINNVINCLNKPESTASLAKEYNLPVKQVTQIIKMTQKSCLDAAVERYNT